MSSPGQDGSNDQHAPDESVRVFMSYRRTDDVHFTGRFYDKLVNAFGEDSVFRDIDSIPPGSDFAQVIIERLRNVEAVIALIGPTWGIRLHTTEDFVRMEIARALASGLPVLPVLVEDTPLPERADLPEEVQALLGRNAVRVRRDPDFHRDSDRVIGGLRRAVQAAHDAAVEERLRAEQADDRARQAAHDAAVEERLRAEQADDRARQAAKGKAQTKAVDHGRETRMLEPAILRHAHKRGWSVWRVTWICLLIPIAIVFAAILDGSYGHDLVSWRDGLYDVWSLMSKAEPVLIAEFPISRDLMSVAALLLASTKVPIVYAQSSKFVDFFTMLQDPALFSYADPDRQQEFLGRLDELDAQLRASDWRAALRVLFAVAIAFGFVLAFRNGIFKSLYPGADNTSLSADAWAEASYGGWWLNLDNAAVSPVLAFLVLTVFVYAAILQNEMIAPILFLIVRHGGEFHCGFDLSMPHKAYGWAGFKSAWTIGLVALIFDGLLLVYLAVIAPSTLTGWLIPLVVLYIVAVPAFGVFPLLLFRIGRKRAKAAFIEEAIANHRDAQNSKAEAALIDNFSRVPNDLVDLRSVILIAIPQAAGVLSLVITIAN